jgi:hypothetical protein
MKNLILTCIAVFSFTVATVTEGIAQITIVNYDFNHTCPTTFPPVLETGITCSVTSTQACQTYAGTVSGAAAFTANATAGQAIAMANSSGTNTKYFQFQLDGTSLVNYTSFRIYFQAQRSAAGAQTITLQYSTDGITYTSFGTMAPGNGSFAEGLFDLSSVAAINNPSVLYFRLTASGANGDGTGTGTLRVDNFQIQATLSATGCTSAAEPTVHSSSLNFTDIQCFQVTLNWTNGNGTNRIVVAKASSAVTGSPADNTGYTANALFGAGNTIAANEFVVYNGSGSSVTITGLSSSTTYYFTVFEYNGSGCPSSGQNYLTGSGYLTGNVTTATCSCPVITGILVDACGSCEGSDELFTFVNGDTDLNINSLSVTFPNGGTFCNSGCGGQTWVTNSAFVNDLNITAGCAGLFVESSVVPANAKVVIFTGASPTTAYDYSGLCGTGPYYIIFANYTGCTGRFANYNSTGGTRTLSADFGSGCSTSVTYDRALLHSGDGACAYFNENGDVSYGSEGCAPTAMVLPIELISFTATVQGTGVILKWSTASEINNDYFNIERSADSFNILEIAEKKGAGNSNTINHYTDYDAKPFDGINYYRLKQTDYDGNYSYSDWIAVKVNISSSEDIKVRGTEIDFFTADENCSIFIADLSGRVILSREINQHTSINLSGVASGIYFAVKVSSAGTSSKKFNISNRF